MNREELRQLIWRLRDAADVLRAGVATPAETAAAADDIALVVDILRGMADERP
jgi:hypothetical protein